MEARGAHPQLLAQVLGQGEAGLCRCAAAAAADDDSRMVGGQLEGDQLGVAAQSTAVGVAVAAADVGGPSDPGEEEVWQLAEAPWVGVAG